MKTCSGCGVELTDENCYKKAGGYFRAYCKVCHNNKSDEYNKISSKSPHRREKVNARKRAYRQNPDKVANIIVLDTKGSDKKHNRENDLTKEFVQNLIKNGCSYCGDTKLRITLDRIDNSKGHIQDNVVSACIRCNYARGNMPYEAWLCLIKGMKEAREKGLFGDWAGRCR